MDTDKLKQVIVIRKDLKMRRGKEIAQGAHAAVGATLATMDKLPETFRQWNTNGHAKITLIVESEDEFHRIAKEAKESGLIVYSVLDEGITEFKGNHTWTALAIGPAKSSFIDPITGNLKLY